MRQCEKMMKQTRRTSKLEADNGKLKRLPVGAKMCEDYDLGAVANLTHIMIGVFICRPSKKRNYKVITQSHFRF